MAAQSGSSSVPSLPLPQPKSPPEYPDLYGKRREMAKVQMLEREISFLEEELKSVERLQPASKYCKEVADFVVANSDPLIPTIHKNRRSCRFWKWLCGAPCFNFSWIFCCCCCCCNTPCSCHLECPRCCNFDDCHICCCPSCISCSMPKWQCWSCPRARCCRHISCSCCRNCCIFRFPSCPDCSCCKWSCSCLKCPKVRPCFSCSGCRRGCCNRSCLFL